MITAAGAQPRDGGGTFWNIHAAHIGMLAAWLLVVAVVYLRAKLRARTATGRPSTPLPRNGWLMCVAAAAVTSGGIHLTVIGEHFHESALYGTFFLLLTVLQFGWAARLIQRPTPGWLFAGAAASILVVLLWLATRTIGIPIGPAAGERETFGSPDILASAAELALAVFALAAVRTRERREYPAPRFMQGSIPTL